MFVERCRLLEFPRISDPRGALTCIEAERHVPFPVRRVFYLYDVPAGQTRGGHAHKQLEQVLVCLSGSFEVIAEDGIRQTRFQMNRPSLGLYVPPMIWDTEVNFSPGAVCMVLASDYYDESDYCRDYAAYLEAVAAERAAAATAQAVSPYE